MSTDEARAVWVENADPAAICADDILDLAKIVGDVDSVKLQYHAEKRTVIFRVVFRQTSAARAFLHLEGTRFKDCTLHLSSTVYGSVVPPPAEGTGQSSSEDAATKAADGGAPTTSGKEYAVLPYFNDFAAECRLDELLVPSLDHLVSVVGHWRDPEHCPRPKHVDQDALAYLATQYGLDVLGPVIDQFLELHTSVGSLLRSNAELKTLKAEKEAEMQTLLKKRGSAVATGGAAAVFTGLETMEVAESAKPRRIRNALPVSSQLSHPVALVSTLCALCGPIAKSYVTYTTGNVYQATFAFHVCIEFATAACAERALSMLQKTYTMPTISKRGASRAAPDAKVLEMEEDIAMLGMLRTASWDYAVCQLPMPLEPPGLASLQAAAAAPLLDEWRRLLI